MTDFKAGKHHLLLATTIVGAGVDIPDVNHIMIMSPHRFGLAQLHQLRGRVGRDKQAGYCYLCLNDDQSPPARLQALVDSNDGFELSELDLKQRGPGAIYGQRQSGQLDLKFARLTDKKAVERACQVAGQFIASKQTMTPELARQIKKYQQISNFN